VTSHDEIGELRKWFNAFIAQLDEMIRAISQNALQVATASEELTAPASRSPPAPRKRRRSRPGFRMRLSKSARTCGA